MVKNLSAESAAGTQNQRTRSVHKVLPYRAVHGQLYFNGLKINACEIRDDFRRKPNALHHPVIYQSVKLLHRTVAYPTVPYDLTQNR